MIYKQFNEFIPNLELSIIEYYTECYDIQNRILEDPILVLSYNGRTVLGFESKTKENIEESAFSRDTPASKELYKKLQKSKFYFALWYEKDDTENLQGIDMIFTTKEELKNYMNQFLLKGIVNP